MAKKKLKSFFYTGKLVLIYYWYILQKSIDVYKFILIVTLQGFQ